MHNDGWWLSKADRHFSENAKPYTGAHAPQMSQDSNETNFQVIYDMTFSQRAALTGFVELICCVSNTYFIKKLL